MTKKRACVLFFMFIAAALFLIVGCADPTTDAPEEPSEEIEVGVGIAGAPDSIKIGFSTFLSGPASSPFGIPAAQSAEVIIEHLNRGDGPAPYDQLGIGGVPIEYIVIDEAGGAERQVAEYRRLVLDEQVDIVIGYISSADALAVAPVAEELETLTIIFDAGTNQIFEEADYHYVFRTKGHQIIDSIGMARYALEMNPDIQTIAGINQDYAWGHDSWNSFKEAMLSLKPDIEVVAELFPSLYAGEYSSEISALLNAKPDFIHTSLWGGDMEAFMLQASARGLHEQSTLGFGSGDTMLPRLSNTVPPGVVIGARGPHGQLAPQSMLGDWFEEVYGNRYLLRPVYPSYHMSQALFGIKMAYENALAAKNYEEWPSIDEVIAAFKYLEFDTPSGIISMAIGGGHQAVEPVPYGTTGEDIHPETGERVLINVIIYEPEMVNPPDGVKSIDWIRAGFPLD